MSLVVNAPVVEMDQERPAVSSPSRGSFWSRHKTLVNFWLDATLMVLFLAQSWLLTVLTLVFPRSGVGWTIWGGNAGDWLDALFFTSCVFAVGVVLHVMLHWSWVCGTISTKLLGRKAAKDDGTQTLIGVGFLMLLLHILGIAVLAAKVGLVRPD